MTKADRKFCKLVCLDRRPGSEFPGYTPLPQRQSWPSARICAFRRAATAGAVQSETAKPAAERNPLQEPKEKMLGHYSMHSSVELGGVITENDGSRAMWATMVNERTGMRILNQSLELRTMNPSKTPFFDTHSSASVAYGGEPNEVSFLKMSKGKLYDFTGSFRRDRNYFDYNLLANSLLSTRKPLQPNTGLCSRAGFPASVQLRAPQIRRVV